MRSFFLAKLFSLPKGKKTVRKPLKIKDFSAFLLGKKLGKASCQEKAPFAKEFARFFHLFFML